MTFDVLTNSSGPQDDDADGFIQQMVMTYMAMMKKCGRDQISAAEIYQYLGVEDIPDELHEQFYSITDKGLDFYQQYSKKGH